MLIVLGNMFQVSFLTSDLSMDYRTVENYVNALVNTYIIKLVSPFYKNVISEIRKSKKVYFVDLGLRNAVLNNFSSLDSRTDKGQLLENFVLNEFYDFDLKYWRTTSKAEVDFVLLFEDEIVPIEVQSLGRLKRSYLSFLSRYKPKRGLVFTDKEFGVKKIGSTDVLFLPHWMI